MLCSSSSLYEKNVYSVQKMTANHLNPFRGKATYMSPKVKGYADTSCARHIYGTIPVNHWRHAWYYTRSNNCGNNINHFLGYILNTFLPLKGLIYF